MKVEDIIRHARTVERYENPIYRPLSEENFRYYDTARRCLDNAMREESLRAAPARMLQICRSLLDDGMWRSYDRREDVRDVKEFLDAMLATAPAAPGKETK